MLLFTGRLAKPVPFVPGRLGVLGNLTSANAITITNLNTDYSYDTQDQSNGTSRQFWTTFVPSQDGEIGIWGYTDLGNSVETIITDPGGSQLVDNNTNLNAPEQFYFLGTHTYLVQCIIRFQPYYPLNLSFKTFVPQNIPAGSIIVNNDTQVVLQPADVSQNLEAAIISAVDGTPLKFLNTIVVGEGGDINNLLSGDNKFLFTTDDSDSPTNAVIYNPDFSQLTSINLGFTPIRCGVTGNGKNKWYIAKSTILTPVPVAVIDNTGALVKTLHLTSIPHSVAVLQDDTKLYYSVSSTGVIKAWDVVNDVALPDLAAALATYSPDEPMLCLGDGTIVVPYEKAGSYILKRYNSAGTVLNTYGDYFATGLIVSGNRLARALDDPNSFWLWLHIDDTGGGSGAGTSRFINIKVSDGSTIHTFDAAEFEVDVNMQATTLSPTRFGHSESCTFLIMRSGASSSNQFSGLYSQPINSGLTHDQLFDLSSGTPVVTNVSIPTPFARTALIGGDD